MKKKKILSFLLASALSIGMAVPTFAAVPEVSKQIITTCKICKREFGRYDATLSSEDAGIKTYMDVFAVPEIESLKINENYTYQYNCDGTDEYAVMFNGTGETDFICHDCLTAKVNEYKTANGIPTVSGTTAVDTTTGAADVPITVTRDAPTFSVTVPTSMPISVGADGKVTTAGDVAIKNNSSRSVCVKSVTINAASGWTLAKFDKAALRNEAIDSKKLGFSMTMGTKTAATTKDGQTETIGSYTASDVTIDIGSQLAITYDGVIPTQVNGIAADTQAASVVFTVDWAA